MLTGCAGTAHPVFFDWCVSRDACVVADDGDMSELCALTAEEFGRGHGLVFLLGAFRSGTTLVRKVLDSHPQIHSPAETWFLLPLVNLWEGVGESPRYRPAQAAAAIRQHLSEEQFLECCRAFAGTFFASNMPRGARVFVDKTPMYLNIAGALPRLFPEARFLVLARDPRGILWSRHTWRHADGSALSERMKGVAGDVRRLASFYENNRARSTLVGYEQLCEDPSGVMKALCEVFGVRYDPAMVQYGSAVHHEGYGDENTREHMRPHGESVRRWQQGVSEEDQRQLFEMCTGEVLRTLGLAESVVSRAA